MELYLRMLDDSVGERAFRGVTEECYGLVRLLGIDFSCFFCMFVYPDSCTRMILQGLFLKPGVLWSASRTCKESSQILPAESFCSVV